MQGIEPAEQRAVDYTLDVLMPQGPMNDERPWYNVSTNEELERAER